MKTIILVRHSEPQRGTNLPNEKITLSEKGRRLARGFFAGGLFKGIQCIYSSPYLRAAETAGCLSEQVAFDGRLVERALGEQECLDADFWAGQYRDLDFKNRNGESLNEVARRMDACISGIRNRLADGEKAVVVSHAAAICAYLTKFCTVTVVNAEEKIRRIQFGGRTVLQGKIHTPSAFVLQFERDIPVEISYRGAMELETNRLLLRLHTFEDFEDYYAYIMDRELQHMLGLNGVDDRDCAIVNFQWLLDNVEFLAVVDKASRKAIGHICIHPPYEGIAEKVEFSGKKGASLSFAIARQEQRKGLMLEALQALMEKLFREDGFDYLDCEYTTFNTASAALQKKLGFRYWGTEQLEDVELIINIRECGDQ